MWDPEQERANREAAAERDKIRMWMYQQEEAARRNDPQLQAEWEAANRFPLPRGCLIYAGLFLAISFGTDYIFQALLSILRNLNGNAPNTGLNLILGDWLVLTGRFFPVIAGGFLAVTHLLNRGRLPSGRVSNILQRTALFGGISLVLAAIVAGFIVLGPQS